MVVSEPDDVRKTRKENLPNRFLNDFTSKHRTWVTCCGCASVSALPIHLRFFVVTGRTGSINQDHCIIPLQSVLTGAISLFRVLRSKRPFPEVAVTGRTGPYP